MSHIYQPLMIKALLKNDGQATTEEIAKALLAYDQSQVEYYSLRTKTMVGKVLTNNGVVESVKDGRQITGYRLTETTHTEAERAALQAMCDEAINAYISKRGEAIWGHRGPDSGYVSGSIRYNVLKRAKHRCELCGGHEDQVALHVDHTTPRSKGGPDHISNYQALCMTCNTNKRDTDDTDFRGILDSYNNRQTDCIFCELGAGRIMAENELCIAIKDAFPVTEGHTLIIPKRHVADYFDLYQPERNAIEAMLHEQRQSILEKDNTVTGFNVGINAGASAGQTVFHLSYD
ncbi:HIT domain-containing protein [Planktotalea frisia]|nr:HIT domain-containing protein [Planktotalea frisia]